MVLSRRPVISSTGSPSAVPGPFGYSGLSGRIGSKYWLTKKHTERDLWWRTAPYQKPYQGIQKHITVLPRVLLDRDAVQGTRWTVKENLPDMGRWERVVNGMRWSEDRVHYVEEDGEMHAVNWRLYSDRLNAELQQTADQLPSYTIYVKGVPMTWKKFDLRGQWVAGLSLREAIAQCKIGGSKSHLIMAHLLERLLQGAENKGLDKEKLRVHVCRVYPGMTDKAIDFRSKGYYAWRVKRSANVILGAVEDPEMLLPDRTVVPYATQLNLRKAGISAEETILDVPAITADGI